jgi:hypothetical protein
MARPHKGGPCFFVPFLQNFIPPDAQLTLQLDAPQRMMKEVRAFHRDVSFGTDRQGSPVCRNRIKTGNVFITLGHNGKTSSKWKPWDVMDRDIDELRAEYDVAPKN